jgi:signal transduction histidine kinase
MQAKTDLQLQQQLLLARQREQELLLGKQQLELANKEKTLQRLKFLHEQADLQQKTKEKETQLLQSRQKAAYDKTISDKQIRIQQAEITLNKRVQLFLIILACMVLAVAGLVYYSRMKTIKLNLTISDQKAELEQLGKVKDKIFSVVSHDLRAPVNNLVAFRSILEEGDVDADKLIRYIDQVKGTMDHTSVMMENLLNWSASQMEGFRVQTETLYIQEICERVLSFMNAAAVKKQIQVQLKIEQADIAVLADRNMTELVIRNLVQNAVKFTKPGGTLVIGVQHAASGKTVLIDIKDNGIGMSKDKVDRINAGSAIAMESRAGTAREKGTGLGLMLCQEFAVLMQGELRADSKEGEGSTFRFILPSA